MSPIKTLNLCSVIEHCLTSFVSVETPTLHHTLATKLTHTEYTYLLLIATHTDTLFNDCNILTFYSVRYDAVNSSSSQELCWR
jgi:hypothetical protein